VPIPQWFSKISRLLDRGAGEPGASPGTNHDDGVFLKADLISRRKHPRVTLDPLHAVSFELMEGAAKIDLGNLSISGMGLFASSLPSEVKNNDLLEGILHCGSERVKATARVVHLGQVLIGCQFVGHDAEVNRLVQSYFSLELNALSMISVRSELLQEDPDGTPHWIHGKNNCELFFVSKDERVIRFNLTFFGNYVEGGEEMRPKYGQIMEEDDGLGKPRHKSSALIRWDPALAAQLEPYALRFLGSVPYLEESHRKAISRVLGQKK
jgi:hypothetical protein